jgi:hypothetical protein
MWHIWRKEKVTAEFWWGNLTERNHLEDLGIDERVILKYIFKNWLGKHRLDLCTSISEQGQVEGS